MGKIHRMLDELDQGLWDYPEPDIKDGLDRLILAWSDLSQERKKIILAIAEAR